MVSLKIWRKQHGGKKFVNGVASHSLRRKQPLIIVAINVPVKDTNTV